VWAIIDTPHLVYSVYPIEDHSNWMELNPDNEEEIPKDFSVEKRWAEG
jgi:hypothetical protein